ncbi:MAG: acyl-CoA synthetase [candidate division Zixibacteria bacterium]|nr:acyl-CoA synthetase [candidate division Zixibacteria bacterium]
MTNFAVDVVDLRALNPKQTAVVWHADRPLPLFITFRDLKIRSDKTAQMLIDQGVRPGDRVLILLPLCPEWWECVLGCMKAGAVPVLDDAMPPPGDLTERVRLSGASTLIASVHIAERIEEVVVRTSVSCKIGVGWEREGWVDYDRRVSLASPCFDPFPARADDVCLVLMPEAPQTQPIVCRHGDKRFGVHLLDAFRQDQTIEVRTHATAG